MVLINVPLVHEFAKHKNQDIAAAARAAAAMIRERQSGKK
jgi:hypothetical protein